MTRSETCTTTSAADRRTASSVGGDGTAVLFGSAGGSRATARSTLAQNRRIWPPDSPVLTSLTAAPNGGSRALAKPAAVAERDRGSPLAGQPWPGRAASERAESGHGGPEFTQDGRRPGRILEHPPVAEPVEGDRLGAGPCGGPGRRGRAQE